ncbi:hypothetical protein MTO96_049897 [Rhipicephalus appendiculatus]
MSGRQNGVTISGKRSSNGTDDRARRRSWTQQLSRRRRRVLPPMPPSSPQPVEDTDEAETGVSVQTDMTASNIEALEKECVHLNQYLYTARVKMELLEMTEEMLRRCEPKVIYYTGLSSFNTLQAVFKLLERYVPHGVNNSLTKFQEFVIFMMKMKLCLPNADIAFRFNVSEATVSRIF